MRAIVLPVVVCVVLAASPANAQAWLGCKAKIEKAHHAVEVAIVKFGHKSPQAARAQAAHNAVRMWCWRTYKGWWDERYGRWRTERWQQQTY